MLGGRAEGKHSHLAGGGSNIGHGAPGSTCAPCTSSQARRANASGRLSLKLSRKCSNRHYVAVRFAACTFGGSWCGRPLLSLALAEPHGAGEVLAGHEGGVDAAAYAFRRKEAIVIAALAMVGYLALATRALAPVTSTRSLTAEVGHRARSCVHALIHSTLQSPCR